MDDMNGLRIQMGIAIEDREGDRLWRVVSVDIPSGLKHEEIEPAGRKAVRDKFCCDGSYLSQGGHIISSFWYRNVDIRSAKAQAPSLRQPFYSAADGIHSLGNAIEKLDDPELGVELKLLQNALEHLRKRMTERYQWD